MTSVTLFEQRMPQRAEGSASDEAQPSEENRRADERGHQ